MVMLRRVEIFDAAILYYHLSNPRVLRYSRLKPNSVEDMEELIKTLRKEEDEHLVIPRVMLDELGIPIGMIILWDYCPFRQEGFLATWIGEEHWGKGYNQRAKNLFFDELFSLSHLNKIFLLIRNHNERSIAACRKLNYTTQLDFLDEIELREFYQEKISHEHIVFCIFKEDYVSYKLSEGIGDGKM